MTNGESASWKAVGLAILLGTAAVTAVSAATGLWVLTAIPIGFLFGFFLEKADLCGASAFSEVLLMKDWAKLKGIWVVIVVSMLGFALLSGLGLVKLNPKPLLWANMALGGLIFGVGMVLAGGCVSGSLFKTGQGNLNSMAALVGIPLGVCAVEYGPLKPVHTALLQHVVKGSEGGVVTLSSMSGLPYGYLAVGFGLLTLAVVLVEQRGKQKAVTGKRTDRREPVVRRILTRPWRPWQAGIAIGILGCFAYLSSAASGRNYPLGVTHGVMQTQLLVTDHPIAYTYAPPPPPGKDPGATQNPGPQSPYKKVSWWLVFEVTALVLGSNVSARLSGRVRFFPKPPDETVVAFFGGILVGVGAGTAGGCVIGNIMSGYALMSVGNILFGVVVLLANWAATYFYLMGGGVGRHGVGGSSLVQPLPPGGS
jgi:hypothetical protein